MSTAVGRRLGTGGTIICSHAVSAAGVVIMAAAALPASARPESTWTSVAVLAAGQLAHGWAMGISNSHEMSYRQAITPDSLQARTNTTMRSLNRAVIVVVSPIAGLGADRVGSSQALVAAALIFCVSALLLALSPFRHVRVL